MNPLTAIQIITEEGDMLELWHDPDGNCVAAVSGSDTLEVRNPTMTVALEQLATKCMEEREAEQEDGD